MKGHVHSDRLIAYMEGRTSEEESTAIGSHIESCGKCRDKMENLAFLEREVGKAIGIDRHLEKEVPQSLSRVIGEKAGSLLGKERSGGSASFAAPASPPGRRREIPLRLFVVALAATVLLVLTVVFFGDAAGRAGVTWRIAFSAGTRPAFPSRGLPETRPGSSYRIEVIPGTSSYISILDLDPAGELSFIYPFLDENGCEKFGLEEPFRKGERTFIPPKTYSAFDLDGKEGPEYLFLVPSGKLIEEKELRLITGELRHAAAVEGGNVEEESVRVLEWLEERFPGTLRKRIKE